MADPADDFSFGLIGWPLEFSLSPVIHAEFFRSTGITGKYTPYPVNPEGMEELVFELLRLGITGLNVTYPHKGKAARICDRLENYAADLQLINTISKTDGKLTGYNTDVYGFDHYIDSCGLPEPFFIIGSGGAARAADYVLNARHLQYGVFCRNSHAWNGFASPVSLNELAHSLMNADTGTVVNATTIGWRDDDSFPLAKEHLEGRYFADMNYNASWHWRNNLSNYGVNVLTGETMLVHQAARSFEIWTGVLPRTDIVLEKLQDRFDKTKKGCDFC